MADYYSRTITVVPAEPAVEGREESRALAEIADRGLAEMAGMAEMVRKSAEQMAAMAEMLRITNERMAAMEAALKTIEKVTPGQVQKINLAIREKAAEICEEYRIGDDPKKRTQIISSIRKTVRELTGCQANREIPRCDYETVVNYILEWDDYERIQKIRKGIPLK